MRDFMPDDGALVDGIDAYVRNKAEIIRILVDNPVPLYGF